MTEKDMKKLSRADLLQMLIDQSTEMKELQEKLEAAEKAREAAEEARRTAEEALKNREITLNNAGSIAEAALQLNGVFAAAQASCQQYIDNVRGSACSRKRPAKNWLRKAVRKQSAGSRKQRMHVKR